MAMQESGQDNIPNINPVRESLGSNSRASAPHLNTNSLVNVRVDPNDLTLANNFNGG